MATIDELAVIVTTLSQNNADLLAAVNVQKSFIDNAVTGSGASAAAAAANSASASSANADAQIALAGTTSAAAQAATYRDQANAAWAASMAPAETLPAISGTSHSGAVVKTFLYDTSKDSDGGAWRNRCAHTSWENETLCSGKWIAQKATTALAWATSGAVAGDYFQNTTDGKFYTLTGTTTASEVFRGSGRKFPAVVNIVAESARVVIYDAATGAMWGVISCSAITGGVSSLCAANGAIVVGASGAGAFMFKYIADSFSREVALSGTARYVKNLPHTSGYSGWLASGTVSIAIVNATVNDIAITILDGAILDAATGLPTPTISVFTAGGMSVIKNDGTVVNSSSTVSVIRGAFDGKTLQTIRSDGVASIWNDISKVSAATVPDTTYTASSSPALMGTTTVTV